MSMVFGRQNDMVSKSWSDMWEEDVEEDEQERARQLQALKELNSRTWSHESKTDAAPTLQSQATSVQPSVRGDGENHEPPSPVEDTFSSDIDGDLIADGFFFHDAPAPKPRQHSFSRQSPPSKRELLEKWAELGERRRAYAGSESKSPDNIKSKQQQFTLSFNNSYGLGSGGWDYSNQHSQKWNRDRAISRGCPWNKGRDWNIPWRREKRHGFGDEWVGHWQETRVI